jgi:hypothetical protein
MIKYNLLCKNCNLTFDSWFASSKEYEKLKKNKLLNCHNCNSLKVEKSLMAPKLITKNSNTKIEKQSLKFKDVKKKIKEYQNFIKNNFRYVGKNFAFEARSIHYDDKKNKKNIYGIASKSELKELKEEGIDTQKIYWEKNKSN